MYQPLLSVWSGIPAAYSLCRLIFFTHKNGVYGEICGKILGEIPQEYGIIRNSSRTGEPWAEAAAIVRNGSTA